MLFRGLAAWIGRKRTAGQREVMQNLNDKAHGNQKWIVLQFFKQYSSKNHQPLKGFIDAGLGGDEFWLM